MNHYIKLATDELSSVKGQRDYCEQKLSTGGIQEWESKEYSRLIEDYTNKIIELEARIQWMSEE